MGSPNHIAHGGDDTYLQCILIFRPWLSNISQTVTVLTEVLPLNFSESRSGVTTGIILCMVYFYSRLVNIFTST